MRRLHSLSGLIPVGAYMVVHLLTNSSVLDSAATFQENVYRIHSLGKALWLVEWGFIFLPLLFHAIFGVIIIRGGLPNNSNYPYARNLRYTLQRVSGMIAFVFILWHVFHLHGWFHSEAWLTNVAEPLGGAQFRPYNAASSLALALRGFVVPVLYAIGVISCVFHLANGIWTMGITWGVWVSPQAQTRASWICLFFGLGLGVVGLSALTGAKTLSVPEALESEDRKFESKLAADDISAESAEHKRFSAEEREKIAEQFATDGDAGDADDDDEGDDDDGDSETAETRAVTPAAGVR
ncbi:MAG: succinate dehydrogenase cytochrome b558 subunit [Planctomycetales bacterium]|nr:succinate dehydrogenase cytochrome b558 subunit [Planctomycetales bacterium]